MKKTFKFFMMAAIVAAGFTACSSEEVTPDPKNPIDNPEKVEGKETYAYFSLPTGDTRAYTPTLSPDDSDADVNDKLIDPKDITLLIYKSNSGVLEKKVDMEGTSKTVLVTAGKKKIFVVANYKDMSTSPNNMVKTIGDFAEGSSTIDELMALYFDAKQANTSAFNFSILHKRVSNGGLPATNDNSIEYDLKSDIDSETAAAGDPKAGGESTTNTFKIQLNFMLAKANLYLATDVIKTITDTEPGVNNIQYAIRNLARKTNLIRKGKDKGVQSYYFNEDFDTNPQSAVAQTQFDPEFDYTPEFITLNPTTATVTPTRYYYVPENNHYLLLRGQSSYFAIKATFEPNAVVKTVEYNVSNKQPKLTTDKITSTAFSDKNYIYTIKEIPLKNGTIPAGSYYKDIDLLRQAAWIYNTGEAYTAANQTDAADILGVRTEDKDTYYYQFTNCVSYYRLDIGEDKTGNSLEPGVLRGNKYQVKIASITGPGLPEESDLIERPWEPVIANTHLHAVIIPAKWTPVVQEGNLN
ncbi:hypothetical protein M2459_003326 [Parabacteroides sp. PF5-5]|uniref:hypothetical protein n=1 Tax=unclassified Parabacteroides TaxID=2649774 RepID=UPI0024763503|nr:MULTISPECIES: hypothetical protein [unclassified Parabacteroides]MDH6306601.1 hypothetical protein [Parabacteroides sp. PH5-39]MDH6317568.1 hypothetical protein [Parabacteroides sp. PF5-13]MDH6321312.1 hypothetical protein [Parabacteroides sp. PH5-13]MDH6325044.1 hypothetical protein [Parabacteroides sp. PH5-8]MDH6328753.1 hypothetical protein [Parabacteroides sp. PH5-41]